MFLCSTFYIGILDPAVTTIFSSELKPTHQQAASSPTPSANVQMSGPESRPAEREPVEDPRAHQRARCDRTDGFEEEIRIGFMEPSSSNHVPKLQEQHLCSRPWFMSLPSQV